MSKLTETIMNIAVLEFQDQLDIYIEENWDETMQDISHKFIGKFILFGVRAKLEKYYESSNDMQKELSHYLWDSLRDIEENTKEIIAMSKEIMADYWERKEKEMQERRKLKETEL